MATFDEFSNELIKLNKNKLIEILYHKSVPDNVTVSDIVRKHINSENPDDFHDTVGEFAPPNLETNISNELKLVNVKLECATETINNLHEIIMYQKTIIDLQKNSQDKGENVNNRNSRTVKSNVAKSGKISDPPRKENPRPTKLASDNKLLHNDPQHVPLIKSKEHLISMNSSPVICGSQPSDGKDTAFSGAIRRVWIHVGKTAQGTSEDAIRDHLQRKFRSEQFVIEKLPQREGANSCSFKVGASFTMLEDLYKSENWPENVTVRRFRFFRDKKNTNERYKEESKDRAK